MKELGLLLKEYVLIVAKCIVNMTFAYGNNQDMEVLIVAKCTVNSSLSG